MPLEAPLAEIDLNVRPLAPIVVLATLSAVAVVVVRVLVVSVAVMVPPPVAVNAGLEPVDSAMAPVRLIVAPELLVRLIPVLVVGLVALIWPEMVVVPPVRPLTLSAWPLGSVIGAAKLIVPLPPPVRLSASPPALETAASAPTVSVLIAVPVMPAPVVPLIVSPRIVLPWPSVIPVPAEPSVGAVPPVLGRLALNEAGVIDVIWPIDWLAP